MALPTWAWCIATYNRQDVLERACALALRQSVPPIEVVITDASEDWERGRDRIKRLIDLSAAAGDARPRLSYEKASMASLPAQRNESIQRCRADVLFLFDDDTLMFPDTAERLLEVYDRDADGVVQAVTARHVPDLPDDPPWFPAAGAATSKPQVTHTHDGALFAAPQRSRSRLARALRQVLRADDRFVPYDPEPPAHPVPPGFDGMDVRSWKVAAGFHLTVRRHAVLRERFEARLKGYSPGEDSDLTYRLTRHGPLLHRPDARIHHMEAPGARFGMFRRTALGGINGILLHRVHSSDRTYSRRKYQALLQRRLIIEFIKDLQSFDFLLSRTRGIAFALMHVNQIMSAEDDELNALFDKFQSI